MKRVAFALACLAGLVFSSASAEAKVVAEISLSAQRAEISVDGMPAYSWPVSTARVEAM